MIRFNLVTQRIRFNSIRFSTTNFSLFILIELICDGHNLTTVMLGSYSIVPCVIVSFLFA